jgi:hypothetical protein
MKLGPDTVSGGRALLSAFGVIILFTASVSARVEFDTAMTSSIAQFCIVVV